MADKEYMKKELDKETQTTESEGIPAGGKVFKSVDELAKAYEESQKVIGRQGQKLGEFKKGLIKEVVDSETDKDQLEADFYDKPAEVLTRLESKIEQKVMSKIQAEKEENDVWSDFFTKRPELKAHEAKIKNDTYTRLWPSIANKSADEQFEVIEKEWNPFVTKAAEATESYEDTDGRSTSSISTSSTSESTKESSTTTLAGMLKKKFG